MKLAVAFRAKLLPSLALSLGLTFALGASSVFASEPPVPAGTAPADLRPGAYEIKFKNGKIAQGEVLKMEGERVRIRVFGGQSATIALSALDSARPLGGAEAVAARARSLADAGDLQGAIDLLRKNLAAHPELQEDLVHYASLGKDGAHVRRREALERYRRELDALLDRKSLLEARARVARELAEERDNPDLIEDALMVDFLIHRAGGLPPSAFKSPFVERLRSANPKSEILRGVEAEMNVSSSLREKWDQEREATIAQALPRAQAFYDAFRNEEAREILEKALKLNPPPEQAARIKEFLAKIDGELATEKADERARRADKMNELRRQARQEMAGSNGRALTDKQFDNLRQRIARRKSGER